MATAGALLRANEAASKMSWDDEGAIRTATAATLLDSEGTALQTAATILPA